MTPDQILTEAASIARGARADARISDIENRLDELEQSPIPIVRSLAQTYRMLKNPFA